jgi:hypothetical protein
MAIDRARGSIRPTEPELLQCAELYRRLAAIVADPRKAKELERLARFYTAKAETLRRREEADPAAALKRG